jgi:hypothetical protein
LAKIDPTEDSSTADVATTGAVATVPSSTLAFISLRVVDESEKLSAIQTLTTLGWI